MSTNIRQCFIPDYTMRRHQSIRLLISHIPNKMDEQTPNKPINALIVKMNNTIETTVPQTILTIYHVNICLIPQSIFL